MCRNLSAGPFTDVDFRREFSTPGTCGFVITGSQVSADGPSADTYEPVREPGGEFGEEGGR